MKKIRLKNGETLVETLASLLIVCTCMIMLAGAIASAVRVNTSARNQNTAFAAANENRVDDMEIYLNEVPVTGITGYRIETDHGSGYYYYETGIPK